MPRPMIAAMRLLPPWRKLKAVAHTLPYDAALVKDVARPGEPLPAGRWRIQVPVSVIDGGKSPESMRAANRELATVLGADYSTLEGQTHMYRAKVLAPAVIEALDARRPARRGVPAS